jgi:glycosyltransferase involved in cell wall biosynthesis
VLVIDDGSAEDVKGALRVFTDARLYYHRKYENRGISAARNHGISLSEGRYLAFIDSDGECKPGKTASQLARLELKGPQYKVCYTCVSDRRQQRQVS